MSAEDEHETDEPSALEQQYRAQLPQILRAAGDDLEAALAALDRYLEQAPPRRLKKSLLTWKGLFYSEHGRYDDAVRELRAADELRGAGELAHFNTKIDLARALEKGGDPREAYAVLTAALDEIEAPDLLVNLLLALVQVASGTGQALPPRAEATLSRVTQHYGIDEPTGADLAAEAVRVAELVRGASVRFTSLQDALQRAETPAERVALVEEYLEGVTVPRFKKLAEDILHRLRPSTANEE